ncbi:MAG: hypothetical protein COS40_15795 [Deltaproteobacteria bacterium CG03_land_8_20_14_0_80_45_14]|nr:MAG: hypothetical protein COS40_15795 [Deltaproteobacteria bacterium CG03_land_8_20_14_0_80_45_14]
MYVASSPFPKRAQEQVCSRKTKQENSAKTKKRGCAGHMSILSLKKQLSGCMILFQTVTSGAVN